MIFDLLKNPLQLVISIVTVIIALSFHEWAHAFAAYKAGDPTAKNMGRMSLDPLRHLDVMGFICMVLFRFGWAKPVPINPNNFKHLKRDEIIVSFAGIVTNFLLGFASLIVLVLGLRFGLVNQTFMMFFQSLALINLSLMIFNLLPIPPLDGYHVVKNLLIGKIQPSIFWNYERYGSIILFGLILLGGLSGFLGWAVGGIYNGITGLLFAILF